MIYTLHPRGYTDISDEAQFHLYGHVSSKNTTILSDKIAMHLIKDNYTPHHTEYGAMTLGTE
jgi:hypothetical protein